MKKKILMSAAKKARLALAVMAVCGMSFVVAQEAFAAGPLPTTDLPVKTDANKNIICGDGAKAEDSSVENAIIMGTGAVSMGHDSVVIGSEAKTDNINSNGVYMPTYNSVAIGAKAKAVANDSTAIGYGAVADYSCSTAIGSMAEAAAFGLSLGANAKSTVFSDAIGVGAEAKKQYSIAIGFGSVADEENTVSVGSGGVTGYFGPAPKTRRIVNVADGINDHDAATVGQVKSMIAAGGGASFDGTKLNTDIQNVDVAGGYKGTTTNANTDTKDTIAGAINSAYQAAKDYTDKQLTDKVGTVTGGTYIEAGKNIAENLGKLDTQVKKNTDAIGNINNLNVAGTGNLVDAVNKAYEAATSAGANVGDLSTLDTTNKANLVGAVNEVNKKAEDAKTTATDALNKANTAQTTATDALNKANTAQTTADNALDKANTNATHIGNLGELNTTNKGNLVGAVNEVNTKAEQNKKDIALVNGRVDELGGRVDALGGAVSKLDTKVNKVGAGAAALAALHPMEFDSDNKLTFAAGVGSYHGASAAAIGAFYRPSEQVMFSIAGNMGNGENMVNAGVSFALDRPSKTPTTKAALVKTVAAQNEQIAALNETLAEQSNALEAQSKEIAELKAMVQQLAAKQNA